MEKSSSVFRTLFCTLVFMALYPVLSWAELTVQIKTIPAQDILPLEVEFEAVVSGGTAPYTYVWGFGDGGTSALVKDSHYYREDGQYTVRLTVFDALDNFGFVSKTITVSSSIFNPANAVFKTYSNTTEITSIVQDSKDSSILWIGTTGGLVRLNTVTGDKKFYLNELPSIYIVKIIQSSDGAIWLGTADGGLARFDYEKDQWTVFNTTNSGLPSDGIYSFMQTSDGAIWVGTTSGAPIWGAIPGGYLVRFDYEKDQWTVFNTDIMVNSLLQTSDGIIWVGTSNGLSRFDYEKNQWTVFNTDNSGLPNVPNSLVQTSDGTIWMKISEGLVRFDYEKNQWTVFSTASMPYNRFHPLAQTSDGAIWMEISEGLARFDYEKNQWTVFNTDNSGLPGNVINSLMQTSDSVLWVGTGNGLVRFDYEKDQWTSFDTASTGMPGNCISSLVQASDGAIWMKIAGSTWMGISYDLVRFDYEKNQWEVFNTANSALPYNSFGFILKTSDGCIWVVSRGEGLARFDYEKNQWTVFNTTNSGLPDNNILSLIQTSDGAIWMGTEYGGLARFDYEKNQWTVFNTTNSGLPFHGTLDGLPCYGINPLVQASDGAIWMRISGSWGGVSDDLVRFDYEKNQWEIFNTDNSALPYNSFGSLLKTSDGGIWLVGDGGLARFDYGIDQWTVFSKDNSGLPDYISSLLQAYDGAIWMGTNRNLLVRFDYATNLWAVLYPYNIELSGDGISSIIQTSDGNIWSGSAVYGLTRLSFPPSTQSPGNLILLAGGGAARTNPLWPTTMELATSAYRIFNARGFKNTDIYFMSPEKWADFNGDGYDDHIVDCPRPDEDRNLTVADLEYAITDRAVKTYTPGTPLFLYIIDHGYSDDGIHGPYFMISPNEILYADKLNTLLNTYETATGGQVIVINESCYSGEFMSRLKKTGRIVITSASNHIVNYDNFGNSSFTHHFLRYLFENNTMHQAFSKSLRRLQESNLTFYQTPQLDDNGDGKYDTNDGMLASVIKLGGDFATGSPWPEITALEKTELSGTSVTFTLTANAHMKRVWATVQPPDYVPDMSGNYQNIQLEFFNLSDPDDNMSYTATYGNFTKAGRYILTFYAKDQFGNVAVSESVNIYTDSSPADVSGDGHTDLKDAILALKICTGADITGQNINPGADINNNQKIGLEEAVYILRKISGL